MKKLTVTGHEGADPERADLRDALEFQRRLLRLTFQDLTDTEAARILSLDPKSIGELVKEVIDLEQGWLNFALAGTQGMIAGSRGAPDSFVFDVSKGDTVKGLLRDYLETGFRTERILVKEDLDRSFPLPESPETAGMRWTGRRAVLQVLAATARTVGRADRIRRALDQEQWGRTPRRRRAADTWTGTGPHAHVLGPFRPEDGGPVSSVHLATAGEELAGCSGRGRAIPATARWPSSAVVRRPRPRRGSSGWERVPAGRPLPGRPSLLHQHSVGQAGAPQRLPGHAQPGGDADEAGLDGLGPDPHGQGRAWSLAALTSRISSVVLAPEGHLTCAEGDVPAWTRPLPCRVRDPSDGQREAGPVAGATARPGTVRTAVGAARRTGRTRWRPPGSSRWAARSA